MNWKIKAGVAVLCDLLPFGECIYVGLQKKFGRLNGDPSSRLKMSLDMFRMLRDSGVSIPGKVLLEIGSGHKPIVASLIALLGAKKVITVDLNRRLNTELMTLVLKSIDRDRERIEPLLIEFSDHYLVSERFDVLSKHKNDPLAFFEEVNIHYLAPADAANLEVDDKSIDIHFSTTVLEHISLDPLNNIFKECKRVLSHDGVAIHFIDLTDHFSHQDNSISPFNYLHFSDLMWKLIADNQFSYTNRLRASDYRKLFLSTGFEILNENVELIDSKDLVLNKKFMNYEAADINTGALNVLLKLEDNIV